MGRFGLDIMKISFIKRVVKHGTSSGITIPGRAHKVCGCGTLGTQFSGEHGADLKVGLDDLRDLQPC